MNAKMRWGSCYVITFPSSRRFITSEGPAEVLPRTPLGYEADTLQTQVSTSQPPAAGTEPNQGYPD